MILHIPRVARLINDLANFQLVEESNLLRKRGIDEYIRIKSEELEKINNVLTLAKAAQNLKY